MHLLRISWDDSWVVPPYLWLLASSWPSSKLCFCPPVSQCDGGTDCCLMLIWVSRSPTARVSIMQRTPWHEFCFPQVNSGSEFFMVLVESSYTWPSTEAFPFRGSKKTMKKIVLLLITVIFSHYIVYWYSFLMKKKKILLQLWSCGNKERVLYPAASLLHHGGELVCHRLGLPWVGEMGVGCRSPAGCWAGIPVHLSVAKAIHNCCVIETDWL